MIQLSVAQARNTDVLHRATIKGTEFANGIAVTDFQLGRFALVFLVLGHFPDRRELKQPIVAADASMTGDDHVRSDPGVVADLDMLADQGIGTNLHPAPRRAAA